MTPPNEGGSERRRWPRVALAARVSLNSASIDDLVDGPLQDLSVGGLFVQTRATRPIGTELAVSVAIADEGVHIECRGLVVREVTAEEAEATGRPAGMGILFTDMDDATRDTLEGLIAEALMRRALVY